MKEHADDAGRGFRGTGSSRGTVAARAAVAAREAGPAREAVAGRAAGAAREPVAGLDAGAARGGSPAGGSPARGSPAGGSPDSGGSRNGGVREAAEQRREQMLRAALEVIVERGYADTRIADVAERTGTSPALVIYYFKTREQLLTEAIRYSEDSWYAENVRRMEEIPTAAGRLAELIGMICLPGTDPEPRSYWLLWLDLWAFSPRSPGVAAVRQKSDEQWRDTIRSIVQAGQEADEFAPVDADDFTITLAALLDGLAVQIALEDPQVPPQRTYELAMRFAAGQLGFDWKPAPERARQRGR